LQDICAVEGIDLALLGGLEIIDVSMEEDAFLLRAHPKDKTALLRTNTMLRLEADISACKPVLVVIDNKGQTIDADEINRIVAIKSGNHFRRLARANHCAIMMLAHPSLSGLASGTGASGSTSWFNTGRGQIDMIRSPGDDDGDRIGPDNGRRMLVNRKANYQQMGQAINVEWRQGCYVCTDPEPKADGIGQVDRAERVFMKLLRWHTKHSQPVSPRQQARNWAPMIFAAHTQRENVSRSQFKRAMDALLESATITVETEGPPSRRIDRLKIAEKYASSRPS
jgi:RecA-family ATPase